MKKKKDKSEFCFIIIVFSYRRYYLLLENAFAFTRFVEKMNALSSVFFFFFVNLVLYRRQSRKVNLNTKTLWETHGFRPILIKTRLPLCPDRTL